MHQEVPAKPSLHPAQPQQVAPLSRLSVSFGWRTVVRSLGETRLRQTIMTALRDRAVYGTFYAGPAALLQTYQQLLKLSGKDIDAAFPEGTWQFYVEYALRDDTARHTCETDGFDAALRTRHITLSRADRLTAWIMTAVYALHQYPRILQNEWRERIATYELRQMTQDPAYARLYREWEKIRPYAYWHEAETVEDYPTYRRRRFDQFMQQVTADLPAEMRQAWQTAVQAREQAELPAYQRQMSMLAYLKPGNYGEERVPLPLEKTHVGLIHNGHYYMLPICQPGGRQPVEVDYIRQQVQSILHNPFVDTPTQLAPLAAVKRMLLPELEKGFSPQFLAQRDQLRLAPIWINTQPQSAGQPLAALRSAERGLGDHPLTIFDTGATHVFDLSHIFFDGIWGVALAEILTNEAVVWAERLSATPQRTYTQKRPLPLSLALTAAEQAHIAQVEQLPAQATAESGGINLVQLRALRQQFKQHETLRSLTINDILILYRAIHTAAYRPSLAIVNELTQLQAQPETAVAATAALNALQVNAPQAPAILIPVDASRRSPKERVHPMTFEVPLAHLHLVERHQQALAALATYERTGQKLAFQQFIKVQRDYLLLLVGLGQVLSQYKQQALEGQSVSIDTIRLLAHLPTSIQRLLDKIPNQFDVINDIVRGREVFSNVGAVVPGSSLTRFMTAKDDNEKKTLAWGVITDAAGKMHITLRDFRPHVSQLTAVSQHRTARRITQDQLNSYVTGLNRFVEDLLRLLKAAPNLHFALDTPQEPVFSSRLQKRPSRPVWQWVLPLLAVVAVGWLLLRGAPPAAAPASTLVPTAASVADARSTVSPLPTKAAVAAANPTATPMPTATATVAPTATAVVPQITQRPLDNMPMVWIPGGTFNMGTDAAGMDDDESPAHPVTLSSYYIDQHEVTVAQYVAFLNTLGDYVNSCNGYTCLSTRTETAESHVVPMMDGLFVVADEVAQLPINNVGWQGARAYCAWVGGRLPTEAEWEFAARGADGRLYPWGNAQPSAETAVLGADFSALQPAAALTAGASPFGLLGMAGGVWEWVADGYDTFYYEYSPQDSPTGPDTDRSTPRVLRGGGYSSSASEVRSTNRDSFSATDFRGIPHVGFRCAADGS